MKWMVLYSLFALPSYANEMVVINGAAYPVTKIEKKNGMIYIDTTKPNQILCTPVRVNAGRFNGGLPGGLLKSLTRPSKPSPQPKRTYDSGEPVRSKYGGGPININSLPEADETELKRAPASEEINDSEERLKYQ